ncbi:MAG TPA: dTMP kinase [Arenimonas sp.]|nr:dTMP kinase [Arenimonas sp.]HPO23215.1 dTMP kinase [Arenimonas sp.]HPW32227.1 dTMP kinase [Arenimonas sp.]
MNGFLISLEGGEGAGKTTVLNALRDCLDQHGFEVVTTREPGGTAAGEMIRQVLLNPELKLFSETELLLMFAARAQLVRELIQPSMARGAAVISDRFTDASFAYQGGGRGLEMGRIAELERWAAVIKPNLTFLLDVSVQQGLERARSRGGEPDRIEREREDFFERVRTTYLSRAKNEPDRFIVIDASQSPEEVVLKVKEKLDVWLQKWIEK